MSLRMMRAVHGGECGAVWFEVVCDCGGGEKLCGDGDAAEAATTATDGRWPAADVRPPRFNRTGYET